MFGNNSNCCWIILLLMLCGGLGNNHHLGNNDCGCGCWLAGFPTVRSRRRAVQGRVNPALFIVQQNRLFFNKEKSRFLLYFSILGHRHSNSPCCSKGCRSVYDIAFP